MSVAEVEQKIADRFRELFHSSWARAAASLVAVPISIWIYATIWTNIETRNPLINPLNPMPRPLTWWRGQLSQVGIHYPHWLDTVTEWHAPHNSGGVVLVALAIGALGATVGVRRSGAPGFYILAFLAFILSAQWFGPGRTIEVYGAMIFLLVAVAVVMAVRSGLNERRRKTIERAGMQFDMASIKYGLMAGPVGVILFPFLYPIILLWKAVSILGHDQGRPGAIELLRNELYNLEQSATLLSDFPAAKAARLFATVQLIAASPVMSRKALDMLSYRGPTGARVVRHEDLTGVWPLPPTESGRTRSAM